MNPDLQNKIDSEAEKKYPDTDNHQHQIALNGFKSGASFVAGILQDEIDRLKDKNELAKFCDKQTKFINGLNDEFQSLKDENKKFREALEHYDSAHYDDRGSPCCADHTAAKALTQKAEEIK